MSSSGSGNSINHGLVHTDEFEPTSDKVIGYDDECKVTSVTTTYETGLVRQKTFTYDDNCNVISVSEVDL